MTFQAFEDELSRQPIRVPYAALAFAQSHAYPDLQRDGFLDILSKWASGASAYTGAGRGVADKALLFGRYLSDELGLQGNTANYEDPRNSLLNEVIERRLGIPITLSVLAIEIGTQIGLPIFGVGLPGHFIVGIHHPDGDIFLDPFHGGRRLDLTDCAELIRLSTGYEGPMLADWFTAATPRETLARLLGNLRASYVRAGRWREAADVIRHLRLVQPDSAEHLRDLGLVYYHQDALPKAAHFLNAYLEQTPQAHDAEDIRNGMRNLLDKWARQN